MIEVGIVGGSGYTGSELLRILLQHPSARVKWVTSRGDKKLEHIHRNFYGMGLDFITLEEARGGDVVFLCTPSRESMLHAERFLEQGSKVVDLGSDFRLKNREIFETVYKAKHTCWDSSARHRMVLRSYDVTTYRRRGSSPIRAALLRQ